MEFDNGWRALFRPGDATRFFEPRPGIPIDLESPGFAFSTAWWMAELSRLVYRRAAEQSDQARAESSRRAQLARVGLVETLVIERSGTHATVIRPAAEDAPFSVVAFRGTTGLRDWASNLRTWHGRWPGGGKVHQGFKQAFEAVWPELEDALGETRGPIFYTGHSLGGALATLAVAARPPRAAYTFGAPRVGNAEFARGIDPTRLFRVVNHRDLVTRLLPPRKGGRFRHAGTLCLIARERDSRLAGTEGEDGLLLERRHPRVEPGVFQPPASLADHTPVNYVAHLERLVEAGTDSSDA